MPCPGFRAVFVTVVFCITICISWFVTVTAIAPAITTIVIELIVIELIVIDEVLRLSACR